MPFQAFFFFFFNDTATTEIYTSIDTLSLHDALPICAAPSREPGEASLRLEGRRALGEEPSLLVLHLPDQPVNQLHQLFAPAADHGASRCGRPAGAPSAAGRVSTVQRNRSRRTA